IKRKLIPAFQFSVFDRLDKFSPSKWVEQGERTRSIPILNLHQLLVLEASKILIARGWHLFSPLEQQLWAEISLIQRHFFLHIHCQYCVFKFFLCRIWHYLHLT